MILSRTRTEYKINTNHFKFGGPQLKRFPNLAYMTPEMTVTDSELLEAIITCGMPCFWLNGSTTLKRIDEINYKLFLLKSSLEVDDDGFIIISDKIKYLDATEKGFISYYIGMIFTKIISRKIFEFEYLVHLGVVSLYKSVKRSKKSPDFVGFNLSNDDTVVFEAKGREIVKNSAVTNAKNQTKSVTSIAGNKPICGVVCVAHPIKKGERLICSMYDPIPDEAGKIVLSKEELVYLYYFPVYQLLDELGEGSSHCSLLLDDDSNNKVSIKMSEDLYNIYKETASSDKKVDEIIVPEIFIQNVKEKEKEKEQIRQSLDISKSNEINVEKKPRIVKDIYLNIESTWED